MTLEVENECAVNPIRTVRLRLPYAPEATVQLRPEVVPERRAEAQEADLNTSAVVRTRPDGPCCGAGGCVLPWRQLVGEGFLREPIVFDAGTRIGAPGGKKKTSFRFLGWTDLDKDTQRR